MLCIAVYIKDNYTLHISVICLCVICCHRNSVVSVTTYLTWVYLISITQDISHRYISTIHYRSIITDASSKIYHTSVITCAPFQVYYYRNATSGVLSEIYHRRIIRDLPSEDHVLSKIHHGSIARDNNSLTMYLWRNFYSRASSMNQRWDIARDNTSPEIIHRRQHQR